MFTPGDLIRVPSNISLFTTDCKDLIEKFKVTQSPKVGIFVRYRQSNQCIINTDGENWIVPLKHVRIMENNNDKVDTNIQAVS